MEFYLVGGAVRDTLLGKNPKDWDFVVVGATPEQMIAAGHEQVGKDFPVFLKNGNEFALARTERSTGSGHGDFVFNTENVTLEDDLRRRDLTINAIAQKQNEPNAPDGETVFIDPFGGRNDLENHILRHIDDEGFAEDPLRVVRLARFCAKFPTFSVDPKTLKLCQEMVKKGMLSHLTPERVSNELIKALGESKPTRFFYFLEMCGALEVLFPEVHQLVSVPAGAFKWHPEGDSFVHTMMVMEQLSLQMKWAASKEEEVQVFFYALLCHDLGKGVTPKDKLPSHPGHEKAGVPLVKSMSDRLKMPTVFRDHAMLVAEFHGHVHKVNELRPTTIVEMYKALKPKSNKYIVKMLSLTGTFDARGRGPFFENDRYPNSQVMVDVLSACEVKASDVCTEEELKDVPTIKRKVLSAQVAAVKEARK